MQRPLRRSVLRSSNGECEALGSRVCRSGGLLAGWLSRATLGSNVCLSTARIVRVGGLGLERISAWTLHSGMQMDSRRSSERELEGEQQRQRRGI